MSSQETQPHSRTMGAIESGHGDFRLLTDMQWSWSVLLQIRRVKCTHRAKLSAWAIDTTSYGSTRVGFKQKPKPTKMESRGMIER